MDQSKYKNNCLLCGAELIYREAAFLQECCFCGTTGETTVSCSEGHFVCDHCHSLDANTLIASFCTNSLLTDPLEQAQLLMGNESFSMHGPEHHFLVPAVLLSSTYNVLNQPEEKAGKIIEAKRRAEKVPGGICGFHGNCGAAVGTGIFVSLFTGATPLSTTSWQQANLMTARSLEKIALAGGPRCCKRNSYLAIREAVAFAGEQLQIEIPLNPEIRCAYSHLNKQCLGRQCAFFVPRGDR